MLVREKRGRPPPQRLQRLLDGGLFHLLWGRPGMLEKVPLGLYLRLKGWGQAGVSSERPCALLVQSVSRAASGPAWPAVDSQTGRPAVLVLTPQYTPGIWCRCIGIAMRKLVAPLIEWGDGAVVSHCQSLEPSGGGGRGRYSATGLRTERSRQAAAGGLQCGGARGGVRVLHLPRSRVAAAQLPRDGLTAAANRACRLLLALRCYETRQPAQGHVCIGVGMVGWRVLCCTDFGDVQPGTIRRCLHAQATAEVLALAEALPQLRAFVHVSTAFVNGHQPQVCWVMGLSQRPGWRQQQHLHQLDMRRHNGQAVTLCMLCALHGLQTESVLHHWRANIVAANAGLQGGRAPVPSVR